MRIVVAIARFVSSLIVAGIVVMIRRLGIMAGDRRRALLVVLITLMGALLGAVGRIGLRKPRLDVTSSAYCSGASGSA